MKKDMMFLAALALSITLGPALASSANSIGPSSSREHGSQTHDRSTHDRSVPVHDRTTSVPRR